MQDIGKLKITVAVKRYIKIKRTGKDKGRSSCGYIGKRKAKGKLEITIKVEVRIEVEVEVQRETMYM